MMANTLRSPHSMAATAKATSAPVVVDLCGDTTFNARAPVISLLDDDDDNGCDIGNHDVANKKGDKRTSDNRTISDNNFSNGEGVASAPASVAAPAAPVAVARRKRRHENDDDDGGGDGEVQVLGPPVAGVIEISDDDGDKKPAAIPDDLYAEGLAAEMARNQQPPKKKTRTAVAPAATPPPPKEATPKQKILDVFPDVDDIYVERLLFEYNNKPHLVLPVLADGPYPTNPSVSTSTSTADAASKQSDDKKSAADEDGAGNSFIVRRPHAAPKYDYLSPSSFEPSAEYVEEATRQLLYDFPYLTRYAVMNGMGQHKNHYSLARKAIIDKILGREEDSKNPSEEEEVEHYHKLKSVFVFCFINDEQRKRLGGKRNLLRERRYEEKSPETLVNDPILKDELFHSRRRRDEWMEGIKKRIKRQKARALSQRFGSTVECSCCFDQVAPEETVACRDEGHLFCVDCIQRYAESQIFASGTLGIDKKTGKPALQLMCCHGDGCQSAFHEKHLQEVLPAKTWQKYTELQFRASIDQAGLGGDICSCPKCGFQADLPPTQMVFKCPMEDCQFESCRKCGKASHIPLRCEEVEKQKRVDEGRLKVEEAISEAKIRHCPKCKTGFVKSDGCNKMTCPCGVMLCYICREVLDADDPYSHFCQEPHCTHETCGKCSLNTNDEEDDKLAMKEAGITAAAEFKSKLSQDKDGDDIDIDVNKIMQGPDDGTDDNNPYGTYNYPHHNFHRRNRLRRR